MRPPHVASRRELRHARAAELALTALFAASVFAVFAAAAGLLLAAPFAALVPAPARMLLYGLSAAGALCIAYAVFIEPYRLTIRRVEVRSPKLGPAPVRLAHLSDIHVRDWSRIEERLVEEVRALRPDLILISGDLPARRGSVAAVRRLMGELASIAPTYCSRGNFEYRDVGHAPLLEGSRAVWLLNELVTLRAGGASLAVAGVDAGDENTARSLGRSSDPKIFSICLYHYPDLVPELERLPYDLVLCGHAHGGQVRLPWIGALVSGSRSGTRYARGVFRSGGRTACVTQGIGCESGFIPRLRFLCPPEIVLITLTR
ncbi:MAG: metallophosphoesterase [Elusimicrobiota bacterium]